MVETLVKKRFLIKVYSIIQNEKKVGFKVALERDDEEVGCATLIYWAENDLMILMPISMRSDLKRIGSDDKIVKHSFDLAFSYKCKKLIGLAISEDKMNNSAFKNIEQGKSTNFGYEFEFYKSDFREHEDYSDKYLDFLYFFEYQEKKIALYNVANASGDEKPTIQESIQYCHAKGINKIIFLNQPRPKEIRLLEKFACGQFQFCYNVYFFDDPTSIIKTKI